MGVHYPFETVLSYLKHPGFCVVVLLLLFFVVVVVVVFFQVFFSKLPAVCGFPW